MHPATFERIGGSSIIVITLIVMGWIAGCSERQPQSGETAPTAIGAAATAAELQALKQENQQLKSEVLNLRRQVEDLSQTPQVLLDKVTESVKAEDVAVARETIATLEKRFGNVPQVGVARQLVAKLESSLQEREAQAKRLEAMGFYALKPTAAPNIHGVTVRVESLKFGKRWTFDSYGDSWHYRDAERGTQFLLLNAVIQSVDKNPNLPEIGVYRIDGKKMVRIGFFGYEFRRWSSHGTFIGLYHDFKNDFAHSQSVPFNAAARIDDSDASQPFAVVVTGLLCHERTEKIGQPEIAYRLQSSCDPKNQLSPDDFLQGEYQVIAFFNKPKSN